MIRIKFEVEEPEETPLPIENENERIKRILLLKFFGNNLDNVGGGSTSGLNDGNVSGTLMSLQKSLEKNGVVPKKVFPKKKKHLDNSTTDSFVAVGSKSIKTEPAESSLSLTTQLNNSLNIQSLLRQNRIQNGWTTNEQSIPIGTQQQQQSLLSTKIEPIVPKIHQEVPLLLDQSSLISIQAQQQQSLLSTTIEPIVPEIHQEVPLLLDQSSLISIQTQQQQSLLLLKIEPIIPEIHQEVSLSLDLCSLIPNLDSEQTVNCDTAEIPSLVQSSSSIPIGTQQQQSFLTKIEPIVPGIHQEVPLFLDQGSSIPIGTQQQQSFLLPKIEPIVPESQEVPLSLDLSSLIPNLYSEETSNCDTSEVPLLDQSFSSIPIGTQQQQSLSNKIEPIVPEINQEVPLLLDLSSLIPNLDFEETANCDTAEIPSLVQSSSLIPIGIEQQQSFLLPKIEPIVPEIHHEVPLSLDLSSLIPNLYSEETANYDMAEIPSLVQSSSLIPIGIEQQQSFLLPKIEPIVAKIYQEVPSLVHSASIPIGTQQQQSFLLPKIEPIVAEIHQEVPLSLDLSSLIPNLDSEETSNCDTAEVPSLVHSASIPIGTQQQQQSLLSNNIELIVPEIHQEVPSLVHSTSIPIGTQPQQSLLSNNIEPIVLEIHQKVPVSLDLSSLIPNLDSEETANCDTVEVPLLDQGSLIPVGTEQQQQSFLLHKIEPIVAEIHQEVPSLVYSASIPIGTQQQQSYFLPKTEPAESSLSLTTQLNNSLNIQSLLRQNRIQNGWTTNEQSIPIGTQQQQQSLSNKIEPIVPEINQEVPLLLDLSSLIPNLDSEETAKSETAEIPSLVQSSSLIPNGTQQQQQSLLLPKIEPIVPEILQEVPLALDQSSFSIPIETQQQQQSLLMPKIDPIVPEILQEVPLLFDQSFSSILNSNSGDTTNNCDTITEMFPGPRAGFGRRAKLNVCYSVPTKPEPVPRRIKKISKEPPPLPTPEPPTTTSQINFAEAGNSESTNNDNYNYSDQNSGFGIGSISGFDSSSTTAEVAAPSAEVAVPLLIGKKPLPRRVPPLTLEEKKARKREGSRLWYLRQKAIPKQPVDPEVRAEKLRQRREYDKKYRKQLFARATPEQRELMRLKHSEAVRLQKEKESEEQRQGRKERMKQYRTLIKQRLTPEEREKIRLKDLERVRRRMEKETDEQRERRLEQKRQYARTVGKQRRMELKQRQTMTLEERSAIEANKSLEQQTSMFSETSFNLVVDNSGKSPTTTSTKKKKKEASNLNRTTIVSKKKKKKRKPRKKHFKLSMSIDSDSSNFDIDCETNTFEPGPSKLPDRSARRCQRNLKSNKYLEPSTDTDSD